MTTNTDFPARAQVETKRLRDRITRLGQSWEMLPFDVPVAAGQRTVVYGTFTGGGYATGGVSVTGATGAADVSMVPWTDGAGSLYLFKWNATTSKMMVTDATGTELANATVITDIVAHPFIASFGAGSSSSVTPTASFRMTGTGRLTEIQFEVSSGFAASNSDFWTLTARVRRANALTPQTAGELLGSYSTQKRTLVAIEPVTLYSASAGVEIHDDDRVLLTAAATGQPAPLAGAIGWMRLQRRVD